MEIANREVVVVTSEDVVISEMCKMIEKSFASAVSRGGNFKIGLSGGSLIRMLAKGLPEISVDWEKWIIFFCDERIVPASSEDSTFGEYKRQLLGRVPLKEEQFVKVNCELGVNEAARAYEERVKAIAGAAPRFDLLLLGVGPDGHTCSLFPRHDALQATALVTGVSDSPKPPPSRVTLTLPVLNNSALCIFPVCGQSKAHIVKEILQENKDYPAGLVLPTNGKVYWLLDKEAALYL